MALQEPHRVRVSRLAPSPTGGLHVGHARTFLLAWLAARSGGGRVILRIEDIDASRVRNEAVAGAIEDLHWLGLDWDEGPDVGGPRGPYLQSHRMGLYHEVLEQLKRAELVYPCTCTRVEIARASSAPHAEDEGPIYPGTCATRSASEVEALGGRPYAWRFRVPPGTIVWKDLIRGATVLDPSQLGGDFIVARSNGAVAYQLAVVVDDAAMGVSQVLRGDDLLPSTPRQILLYRALGVPAPEFGHVPLVLGPDGRRLTKRGGSIKLAALRAQGVPARRLITLLAQSLGMETRSDSSWPFDRGVTVRFDQVPRAPWTFRPELLGASGAAGDHFASV